MHFIFRIFELLTCRTPGVSPWWLSKNWHLWHYWGLFVEGEARSHVVRAWGFNNPPERCGVMRGRPGCARRGRENTILCLTDYLHNGTVTRRFVNTWLRRRDRGRAWQEQYTCQNSINPLLCEWEILNEVTREEMWDMRYEADVRIVVDQVHVKDAYFVDPREWNFSVDLTSFKEKTYFPVFWLQTRFLNSYKGF